MPSPVPLSRAALRISVLALAASSVVAVSAPAIAADGECLPSAPTAESALAEAAICGGQVEVASKRESNTRVWANPDGTLTGELFAAPQWVEQSGEWVDVDPTLVAGSDGVIRPTAALSGLELSAGGGTELLQLDAGDGSFGLTWPDVLPTPVLSGDIATYPEVFAGVDLQIQAESEGFSYVLVVKSAAAAANPELTHIEMGTVLDGVTIGQDDAGVIRLEDEDGEQVGVAPVATMWDTPVPQPAARGIGTDSEAPAPGQMTEIPVDVGADSLTIHPDVEMLTSSETNFPVYIDPSLNTSINTWAPVSKSHPDSTWWNNAAWPRDDTMFVGYNGWSADRAAGVWRSMIRVNLGAASGSVIRSAKFKILLDHSGSCGDAPIELWQTRAITKGQVPTSWNSTKDDWLNGGPLASTSGHANEAGGCSGGVQDNDELSFSSDNLLSAVKSHAAAPYNTITFGFQAPNESDMYQWMRLGRTSGRLELTYDHQPQAPTALTIAPGGSCEAGVTGWTQATTPKLSAKISDLDGTLNGEFELYQGSTKVRTYKTPTALKSGSTFPWQLSASQALTQGATYQWRVRGYSITGSTTLNGAWSSYCSFTVDAQGPTTAPIITLVTVSPKVGVPVVFDIAAGSPPDADVASFAYGLNLDAPEGTVEVVNGAAQLAMDTPTAGGYTLYVWSKDAAGNFGARATRTVTLTNPPQALEVASWRLENDDFSDENTNADGNIYNLTKGTGWTPGAGHTGSTGSAASTTGQSCAASATNVLRTDQSYSVAAWVKLSSLTDARTVVTQNAGALQAFELKYDDNTQKWAFELPYGDPADPDWDQVYSASEAVANRWTHLVGVYDAVENVIRLYVDGDFQGQVPHAPVAHTDGVLALGCSLKADGSSTSHVVGSIDDVGVWQGVLGHDDVLATVGNLPAGLAGHWSFASTDDNGYVPDETGRGQGVKFYDTVTMVEDRTDFADLTAIGLMGEGYAATDDTTLRLDQSFSVSAWVKLTSKEGHQTFVSQEGSARSAFYLKFNNTQQKWSFEFPSEDIQSPAWRQVFSNDIAAVDQWTLLTATYNASTGEMRLYVNGVAQTAGGTVIRPESWHVDGRLFIGASGNTLGEVWAGMHGAMDDVKVWRGVLTDAQVAELWKQG